ncbi:glutamyl-tRNA(Gln) amidotransferase subunit C, mitochondrial-like isoform X1 [Physella acuta]|uniref:glutamyl-tRNA(Gln) amidotransferase subunit C, mitochondrial-like isoform X1 n=3 Tax=Physella acuta TaxID=109671 RepID=UPI0027DE70D5|nr:glutamyl-tRNA(Gln) amidotransferase subunit C, mitochondrial-like isoform X1 [Physella acuta]
MTFITNLRNKVSFFTLLLILFFNVISLPVLTIMYFKRMYSTVAKRTIINNLTPGLNRKFWAGCYRKFSSKVPDKPVWQRADFECLPKVLDVDLQHVEQLERISLVEFSNEEGYICLQNAIKSANTLYLKNTDGVEPLENVLENKELWLRDDIVTENNPPSIILKNASKTEEQYFVAPPGNIPMKSRGKQRLIHVLPQNDAS